MLKPSLIFDLILLAVLLVSAMASYRKGLLTAIVQFAGRLFSLAGAWFVSRKGSLYLFETFLEAQLCYPGCRAPSASRARWT